MGSFTNIARNVEQLITKINLQMNAPDRRPKTVYQDIAYVDSSADAEIVSYPMNVQYIAEKVKGDTEPRDFNDAEIMSFECRTDRIDGPATLISIDPTRNQFGLLKNQAPSMIAQADKLYDRRLAKKINENGKCYDGRNFFDTAHPYNPGVKGAVLTYSNDITAKTDEQGLMDAWTAMQQIPGFDKTLINADLGTPTILCPTLPVKLAFDKLINEGIIAKNVGTGGASETTQLVGAAKTVLMPELIDAADPSTFRKWYLLNTSHTGRGAFIVRDPIKPRFVVTGENDHTAVQYNARAIYYWASAGFGYAMPQLAIRCSF